MSECDRLQQQQQADEAHAIACVIGDIASAEIASLREENRRLRAALKAFVTAEEEWSKVKTGMPAGTFDDPLADAYKLAKAAIG